MDAVCALCEGSGLRVVERADGSRAARECDCRAERRRERQRRQAHIPLLYQESTLDSFNIDGEDDRHLLSRARMAARKFVKSYPLETRGVGLLFTGPIGTGKTHLAIAVLKLLMEDRGVNGMFCHYNDLLKDVQNSYNDRVHETELEVLRPMIEAEVLVIDEMGARKPSDWVSDTVGHLLNTRYNERRTTLVTTNYPNLPGVLNAANLTAFQQTREALRRETLGDRIGDRMHSRLQEMCLVVETDGADYRTTGKRARIG